MEVDVGKRYGAEDLLQAYPLHRACRDGDLSALSSLLGDSVMSVCDAVCQDPLFGWTPAHWASHNGKVDCLQMLLSAGVSCNVATQEKGLTLAHVAALEGQASCLAWLCQNRVAVDARDDMGETSVHKAVRCGSVQCLHILRQHGADLSLRNCQGETAADLAMSQQQGPCLDYFRAGGDAFHVSTTGHPDAGATDGAAGNRKRLQVAEMEMNGEAAKRARVEHVCIGAADVATHLQNPQAETAAVPPHTASRRRTNSWSDGTKNGCDWLLPGPHANGTVMMDLSSSPDQPVVCGTAYGDASVTVNELDANGGSNAMFHMPDNSNHASEKHVFSNGGTHEESMPIEVDDTREAPMTCSSAYSIAMTTHLIPSGGVMGHTKQSPLQKTPIPKCMALRGHYL